MAARRLRLDEEGRRRAGDPEMIGMAAAMGRAMARERGLGRLADDLADAAVWGLVQAAASYDPGRGASFRTHAVARIRGEVLDEIRRIAGGGIAGWASRVRGVAPVASIDEPARGKGGRPAPGLAATIPDEAPPVGWEAEQEEEIEALARRLDRRHGDVVRLLYLRADTATMAGAAAALGRSRTLVCELHGEAVAELRGGAPLPPDPDAPRCGCGRPIGAKNQSGRCASCAQKGRQRARREQLRAEADRRIAAVLGRRSA